MTFKHNRKDENQTENANVRFIVRWSSEMDFVKNGEILKFGQFVGAKRKYNSWTNTKIENRENAEVFVPPQVFRFLMHFVFAHSDCHLTA